MNNLPFLGNRSVYFIFATFLCVGYSNENFLVHDMMDLSAAKRVDVTFKLASKPPLPFNYHY
jgi:hypothetical protein